MTISAFFNSWPGMFLVQSFLHALVAALVVDTALAAWRIENPAVRQRLRLFVLILPLLSFPIYQALSPERGSAVFRLDALIDVNRWLTIEIWKTVQIGILFLLVLCFTAAIFIFQEFVPILRHSFSRTQKEVQDARQPDRSSPVIAALETLPGPKPEIFIINDDDYMMFSSTGEKPAVYISEGLARALSHEELRAALAHELGHIHRSRRPFMVLVFLLRVLMFFNPVVLMEFRRIVQEEEKICDDMAVDLTGSRTALAGALRTFYYGEDEHPHQMQDTLRLSDRIEEYSHSLLIDNRISRLEEPPEPESRFFAVYAIVPATILAINYFVV